MGHDVFIARNDRGRHRHGNQQPVEQAARHQSDQEVHTHGRLPAVRADRYPCPSEHGMESSHPFAPCSPPCRHPCDQHASDAPGSALGILHFTAGRNLRKSGGAAAVGRETALLALGGR